MREFLRGSFALALGLVLLTQEANANCKAHDAEWIKGKSLKVTIPHRTDPGKVLVDWTDAIENGRCADQFYVYVWETHRGETFTKNYTSPSGTYSRLVELDPCVEYQIKVGFAEDDLFGKERENSTVSTFKTEATPTLGSTNQDSFTVQHYFDKVTQKLDYSKASIRFPKSLLQHTSCLKYIEANGIEKVATHTSSRGYNSHFNTLGDITPLSRSSSYSSIASGSSSRSSYGGSGTYGSSSSINSGSYGGYGSFGTSGSFGHIDSFGGSGIHKPGTENGPLDPNNYHDGDFHHDHSFGNHGRADFDKLSQKRFKRSHAGYNSFDPTGQIDSVEESVAKRVMNDNNQVHSNSDLDTQNRYKRSLFGNHQTTPIPNRYNTQKPHQTTTYKPITGVTVDAKILPPFVEDVIEIVVPIKPCSSYTFSVKFVSPQGATLGVVKDLKLLQLHEMHHYHPPTLTEIFKVGMPTSANAPFISLEPYSGIPVECVLPVLKAVDRHMGHLEDELHYHLKKEFESIEYGNKMKAKFLGQKELSLESAGCECSTPILHLNTTDPKQLSKHHDDGLFGTFVYEGMQNGRPYYRRPPTSMDAALQAAKEGKQRHKRFVGKVGTNYGSTYSSGGYSSYRSTYTTTTRSTLSSSSLHSSSSSTDSHLVVPNTPIIKDPPPPGNVYYVYWNAREKSWWVGTSLQAEEPLYKTEENSPAKCPGDTKTVQKWEAPHTFSWKVDPLMVMMCKKQVY